MTLKKRVMLIIFDLKQMLIENKALFWLVIISMSVSTFGIFFFGDYLVQYYKNIESQKGDNFYIEGKWQTSEKENLILAIKKLNFTDISQIICERTSDNIEEQSEVKIKGEFHSNYKNRMLSGDLPLWDEEQNKIVIDEFRAADIADEISENEKIIGQQIDIGEQKYEVVGICSITDDDELIVPIVNYIKNYETDYVEISFKHSLIPKDKEKIENLFSGNKAVSYGWSYVKEPWQNSKFLLDFVQLIGIFVIIGINVLMPIQYLLYKNKKKYCIYSICGGADKDIRKIIFWKIFIHIFIGIILGVILEIVFKSTIGNVDWLYKGDWKFYSYLFVTVIAIQVITVCILNYRMNKGIEIYRIEE